MRQFCRQGSISAPSAGRGTLVVALTGLNARALALGAGGLRATKRHLRSRQVFAALVHSPSGIAEAVISL
jgi:hypothetical protein